ncbi:glycosyltransferase family 2 protein [Lysobacter koreensis]|uniref:Glycosyltransferase family 2 protein n=1 Tax=Lysobacter koreensis TaxID=266122 RepID=A0ABW2YQ46_9GAMM
MNHPRVTVLLLTYNTAELVEAAIAGALAQTVPCRILVSDDASPDGTGERIERALAGYDGPHEVRVFRNPANLGLGAHLSARMTDACGEIVVLMAGDDVSYPDRAARMLEVFDADPAVMVAGGGYDRVDDDGHDLGLSHARVPARFDIHHFANAGRFTTLLGASMAFRREVFERFGPLRAVVEDNALTMRAMLLGTGVQLPAPLIRYRISSSSLSGWVFAKGDRSSEAFVRRYRRMIRMYRDVADDLDHALTRVDGLPADRVRAGRQLAGMYRLEAEQREVILDRPRREWIAPLWRGLARPGLRRKSLERAAKLLLPRAWFGAG